MNEERNQERKRAKLGHKMKYRLISLVLSLAMFVSLFTGIELKAEAYSCFYWGTNTSSAHITLNSTYGCERIPIKVGTSGVYRFYSTDKESGDPYVFLTDEYHVDHVVNACMSSGCKNGVSTSVCTLGYNDDGGGSYNYNLYAYLEAYKQYYIVCTRFSTSKCYYNAKYQFMGYSSVYLNNQGATTNYNSYIYGGNAGYSICNSPNYFSTTSNGNSYITPPLKTGYTFGGYYTSTNGSGTQCIAANGTLNQSNLRSYRPNGGTLYAKWTPVISNITLDRNNSSTLSIPSGGTPSTSAQYTKSLPKITPPTMTGYTFFGYYDGTDGSAKKYYNADGTAAVSSWDKTATSVTLYAHWQKNEYTATLNANGGSGGTTSIALTYDSEMKSTDLTPPTRAGYTFDGYFYYASSSSTGVQYYDKDMKPVEKTAPAGKLWDLPKNATLKAKWTPITYQIEIFSNDDNYGADDCSGYVTTINSTYGTLLLPTAESLGLTRNHYEFVGWNVYDEQDWAMYKPNTIYRTGLSEDKNKKATIYAAWAIKDNYTIVYNANGGTGGPINGSVFQGEAYFIPGVIKNDASTETNEPTRTGYTFIGWDKSPSGVSTTKYKSLKDDSGNIINEKKTVSENGIAIQNYIEADGNTTLYACWERNKTLSYDANGGSFKTVLPTLYPAKNEQIPLVFEDDEIPERTGYTFLGWATSKVAVAPQYTKNVNNTYTMGANDVKLYAVWEKQKFTVGINTSECADCTSNIKIEGKISTNDNFTEINDHSDINVEYNDSYIIHITANTKALNVNGLTVTVNDAVCSNTLISENKVNGTKTYEYTINNIASPQQICIIGLTKQEYKINYDMNGGVFGADPNASISGNNVSGNNVSGNGVITKPASEWDPVNSYVYKADGVTKLTGKPEKRGYTFVGWYTEPNGNGTKWTAIPAGTSGDVTLYANWTANSYTIQFDGVGNAEGGTLDGSLNGVTIANTVPSGLEGKYKGEISGIIYDTNRMLPNNGTLTYTLNGHSSSLSFNGWYTEREITTTDEQEHVTTVIEVTEYRAGDTVRNLATGSASDNTIVLHANWDIPNYRVIYDLNGGKLTTGNAEQGAVITDTMSIVTVKGGSDVTLNFENVSRTGYEFKGWKESTTTYKSDGTTTITAISEDHTLVAIWEPIQYRVDFVITVPDEYELLANDSKQELNENKQCTIHSISQIPYNESNNSIVYPGTVIDTKTYVMKDKKLEEIEKSISVSCEQLAAVSANVSSAQGVIRNNEEILDRLSQNGYSAEKRQAVDDAYSVKETLSENYTVKIGIYNKRYDTSYYPPTADKNSTSTALDNYVTAYKAVFTRENVEDIRTGYNISDNLLPKPDNTEEGLYQALKDAKQALDKETVDNCYYDFEEALNAYIDIYDSNYEQWKDAENNIKEQNKEIDLYDEQIAAIKGTISSLNNQHDARSAESKTVFLGWSRTDGATTPEFVKGQEIKNLSSTSSDTPVPLFAVYGAAQLHYITYDLKGGDETEWNKLNQTAALIDNDGNAVLTANEPIRRFYDFDGWKLSAGTTGTIGQDGKNVTGLPTDRNVTVEAEWTPQKYTITYHSNVWDTTYGKEYPEYPGDKTVVDDTFEYEAEKALTMPAGQVFARTYYKLVGWLDSASSNSVPLYNNGETVKNLGDKNLYAVWKLKETVQISFNANGGDGAPDNITVPKGYPASISTNAPLREGYDFVGWHSDEDQDGNVTKDTILYAAQYDSETGALTGFKRNDSNETSNIAEDKLDTTLDQTLFAIWKEKAKYRIEYVAANDTVGSVPVDLTDHYASNEIMVDFSKIPEKAGYQFDGWKNGDTVYSEATGAPRSCFIDDPSLADDARLAVVSGNKIIFEEQLTPNQYEVEFFDGEKSLGTVSGFNFDADVYSEKQSVSINKIKNSLTKEDSPYEFAGWATVEKGSLVYDKEVVLKNLTVIQDAHVNLYAVMKPKTYQISFNDNISDDSIAGDSIDATYNAWVPPLDKTIPIKPGYDFAGYYWDNNTPDDKRDDVQYYDADLNSVKKFDQATNIELTAKWTEKTYRVIYDYQGISLLTKEAKYQEPQSMPGSSILPDGTVVEGATKLFGWSKTGERTTSDNRAETVYKPATSYDLWEASEGGHDIILHPVIIRDTKYTVTYNANGGTGFPVDTKEYEEGDKYTVKFTPQPVRTDYKFIGWSEDPFAEVPTYYTSDIYESPTGSEINEQIAALMSENEDVLDSTKEFLIDQNVTLYAVWEASSYTIQYISNRTGATLAEGVITNEQTVYCGPDIEGQDRKHLEAIYVLPGYQLLGWSTSDSVYNGVTYSLGEAITQTLSNQNLFKLYTVWKAEEYTVNFDLGYEGAANPASMKVTYDARYGTLPEPERDGYLFKGWTYTDGEGASHAITSTSIVEVPGEHTLTAVWEDDTYTIKYGTNDLNGKTAELKDGFTEADKTLTVRRNVGGFTHPAEMYEMTGYKQIGWSTSYYSNNTTNYVLGGNISETLTSGSSINLYTVWQANEIDVVFDLLYDAAEEDLLEKITVTYDGRFGTLPAPVRKGYTFKGWYAAYTAGENDTFSYPVNANTLVNVTNVPAAGEETITLYAMWSKDSYKIKYDPNYTNSEAPKEIVYGLSENTILADSDIFAERTGYTLEGFSTSSKGSISYGLKEDVGDSFAVDGAVINLYGVWSANTYALSFDLCYENEAEDALEAIEVTYDGYYVDLPVPERAGYIFVGWYDSKDTEGNASGNLITAANKVTTAENHTLYAKWTDNDYKITYLLNQTGVAKGGKLLDDLTVSEDNIITVKRDVDTSRQKDAIYEMTGYTLKGWSTSKYSTNTVNYDLGEAIKENLTTGDNLNLYTVWEANEIEVEFDINADNDSTATNVEAITINYDSRFGSLPIPERRGYTFDGWYAQKTANGAFDQKIESATILNVANIAGADEAVTLQAHWTEEEFTISYYPNYNILSANKISYSLTKDTVLKDETVFDARTGYTLKGFSTSSRGAINYNLGENVGPGFAANKENVNLYGIWEANVYKLYFDSMYENAPSIQYYEITYDQKIGTLPLPERRGYNFIGWYTSYDAETDTYSNQVKATDIVKFTEDTTLYAAWDENFFTITYDPNYGTEKAKEATYSLTTDTILKTDEFFAERPGYTMTGFAITPRGAVSYELGENVGADFAAKNENIKLYCVWSANNYSVTFDSQGGSEEENITVKFDEAYGILPTVEKKDYEFAGWYLDEKCSSDKLVTKSTIVSTPSNHTLYAKWNALPLTYTVYYRANGGVGDMQPQEMIVAEESKLFENVYSRQGYTFLGWSLSQNAIAPTYTDKQEVKNLAIERNAEVELFAVWGSNDYTICYHKNVINDDVQLNKPATYAAESYTVLGELELEETVSGNLISLERAGYHLLGWATSKYGTVTYDAGAELILPLTTEKGRTVHLYAVWELNKVTVVRADGKENYYETLEEALAYVNENRGTKKIYLGMDTELTKTSTLAADGLLDLNGKELVLVGDASLVNKGTIDAGKSTIDGTGSISNNGIVKEAVLNVTVNNENGSIQDSTIALAGMANGGNYTNVVINGTVEGGVVSGNSINNGILTDTDIAGTVMNKGIIRDSYVVPTTENNGNVSGNSIVMTSEGIDTIIQKTDTTTRDVIDSVYSDLKLTAKGSKKSVKLSWKKVDGAEGYIVFGAKLDGSMERIDELNRRKSSYVVQDLAEATFYKFVVVAYHSYDGKKVIFSASKTVQTATKGEKNGVVKGFKAKAQTTKLKVGETTTIVTSVKDGYGAAVHVPFARFESEDPNIATVNENGEVTAVKKGKATIYVIQPDGKAKKIKITVK